jgi:hypothetical protein
MQVSCGYVYQSNKYKNNTPLDVAKVDPVKKKFAQYK